VCKRSIMSQTILDIAFYLPVLSLFRSLVRSSRPYARPFVISWINNRAGARAKGWWKFQSMAFRPSTTSKLFIDLPLSPAFSLHRSFSRCNIVYNDGSERRNPSPSFKCITKKKSYNSRREKSRRRSFYLVPWILEKVLNLFGSLTSRHTFSLQFCTIIFEK